MKIQRALILMCFIYFLGFLRIGFAQQQISVKVAVEKTEVFVGEGFQFQIQVDGSEKVADPDLSNLTNFKVEFLGGRSNSSTSVTIINGKMTRNVRKAYILPYRLVPLKTGVLSIPGITVTVEGKNYTTRPIQIRAKEPEETEDFKLRLSLSQKTCYVNEPIVLTTTWYIGKEVENFQFNFPLLADERFFFADSEVTNDPTKEYIRLPIDSKEIIAQKGTSTLNGKTYTTVVFQKIVIPKDAGNYTIPKAIVTLDARVGYTRPRDLFDDFFSFGRKIVSQRFVVPSNTLRLTVSELPERGKPVNFVGPVGEYQIETSASPREVNVGDPITLTITLTGSTYVNNVMLPSLQNQSELVKNFKIPSEMSSGRISGKTKVFTQTIRAIHENVKEIPPIEFSYFNPRTAQYELTQSNPIPITIRSAKMVDYQDLEGEKVTEISKEEVEARTGGIAFNYEDLSVLENQRYGPETLIYNPLWMTCIVLPFLVFLTLLVISWTIQSYQTDPDRKKAKRAFNELSHTLKLLKKSESDPSQLTSEILEAMQNYLGSKLQISGGTITSQDVESLLLGRGIQQKTVHDLKDIFEKCEAGRYAGKPLSGEELCLLPERVQEVTRKLERDMKK